MLVKTCPWCGALLLLPPLVKIFPLAPMGSRELIGKVPYLVSKTKLPDAFSYFQSVFLAGLVLIAIKHQSNILARRQYCASTRTQPQDPHHPPISSSKSNNDSPLPFSEITLFTPLSIDSLHDYHSEKNHDYPNNEIQRIKKDAYYITDHSFTLPFVRVRVSLRSIPHSVLDKKMCLPFPASPPFILFVIPPLYYRIIISHSHTRGNHGECVHLFNQIQSKRNAQYGFRGNADGIGNAHRQRHNH